MTGPLEHPAASVTGSASANHLADDSLLSNVLCFVAMLDSNGMLFFSLAISFGRSINNLQLHWTDDQLAGLEQVVRQRRSSESHFL